MLNIYRGVDIDTRRQKLLHILPALFVPRTANIGVGQFVNQGDARFSGQHCICVHLRKHYPVVFKMGLRDDLQTFEKGICLFPSMGLHIRRHHIGPFQLTLSGSFKHGVGFANSRGVAEEYLQPSGIFLFGLLGLGQFQHGLR